MIDQHSSAAITNIGSKSGTRLVKIQFTHGKEARWGPSTIDKQGDPATCAEASALIRPGAHTNSPPPPPSTPDNGGSAIATVCKLSEGQKDALSK
jgi:hypothetical protein